MDQQPIMKPQKSAMRSRPMIQMDHPDLAGTNVPTPERNAAETGDDIEAMAQMCHPIPMSFVRSRPRRSDWRPVHAVNCEAGTLLAGYQKPRQTPARPLPSRGSTKNLAKEARTLGVNKTPSTSRPSPSRGKSAGEGEPRVVGSNGMYGKSVPRPRQTDGGNLSAENPTASHRG